MKSNMKCLGQMLAANGSTEADYLFTKQQLWRAYFANLRDPTMRRAGVDKKIMLMKRVLTPSLSYRCPRWPFRPGLAKKLDNLQREMVARCLRLQSLPDEPPNMYFRRVRQQAAGLLSDCRWSNVWRSRVELWGQHLDRHPQSWPSRLLRFHDQAWLQQQRLLSNSRSAISGRTNTRATAGRATSRWPGEM